MKHIQKSTDINSEIVTDSKNVIKSINSIHEDSRQSYDILNRVTDAVKDLKENTVELKNGLRHFKV